MNFPSKEIELKKKKKKNTTKNGLNKDTLKIISPNQLTINSSKNSNSNIFHTDEEEEEINSDEYISSTNLDVDTNTYINTNVTENNETKNEKNINKNINNQKGRLNNLNNIFLNNIYNNNKTINTNIKKGHHYFKSDLTNEINNKIFSTTKGEKVIVTSKSIDRNDNIFTPNNKDNKTLKLLKGIFLKQNKNNNNSNNKYNINNINSINKLNTININSSKENNIKSSNNNNNNNIRDKNIHIRNIQQKNIQNNNININIYNKNIIKDIGGINIDGQKYHLIPQTNKKLKTQGRLGKIINNNQNKKNNNFVYIINSMNNNTTINNNRINSYNNKIKDESQKNKYGIKNLKNLKADNLQKTIHKYLLENKYMTILPTSPNERKNINDIKNINININKPMPLNNINNINNTNNSKKQLRSVNSCYGKKINKNIFNTFQVENILNTISNNHKRMNNNKNKFVLQSCVFSLDNPIKDNINANSILSNKSSYIKKIKPFNTKIKLDLTNEENSIIKDNNNNISLNNNKLKNNSSIKRVIYITNNNNNNLSPNSFNIKSLIHKNNNTNNTNNNINNSDNQRKSAYYIYTSNRINNNNYMDNSGNKILYRKIKKDNIIIKNRINNMNNINNSNTINYNTENKNKEFQTNKKFVTMNNNVSNTNTLNNITYLNKSYIYKKEVLSPFSSINNSKINNINNRIRHNHTHTLTSINSNNIIYELNNNKINNYNGNNFLYFSNDKQRSTLNNKSYGNLRFNNNKKEIYIYTDKNRIENIFKLKKAVSPLQQIKNKFN